jgi:hypothetical protein
MEQNKDKEAVRDYLSIAGAKNRPQPWLSPWQLASLWLPVRESVQAVDCYLGW